MVARTGSQSLSVSVGVNKHDDCVRGEVRGTNRMKVFTCKHQLLCHCWLACAGGLCCGDAWREFPSKFAFLALIYNARKAGKLLKNKINNKKKIITCGPRESGQ